LIVKEKDEEYMLDEKMKKEMKEEKRRKSNEDVKGIDIRMKNNVEMNYLEYVEDI
jgi:hypothetical protein